MAITRMTIDGGRPGVWLRRIAWFVVIWGASVAVLGVIALLIRAVLRP